MSVTSTEDRLLAKYGLVPRGEIGDMGLAITGLRLCCGLRGCPIVREMTSEERARDTYGRGGCLTSSPDVGKYAVGDNSSRVISSSNPNSSMKGRGGGRSTMASRS